jgi:hypothetical protein
LSASDAASSWKAATNTIVMLSKPTAPGVESAPLPRRRESADFAAILAQAVYFVVSGVWPIVSMRSFIWVTGPKVDVWLVKTFGMLVAALGGGMLYGLASRRDTQTLGVLGAGTGAALAAADFYYVPRRRIRPTYLLDGAIELVFVAYWLRRAFSASDTEASATYAVSDGRH